ncbi:carbohydrate ABC transporter permease [Paenibacillus filicis]|uniref:Carbohydrate ABC transporter permease n=1 Tax=Paenibacillus gyeongsangnamensis TaxID=3388067 RepID=A0ABT4QGW6_9BACL|nr:carbohydrate ABC transporter permease [Paenibacillus filicis]MCZ8516132.1 carbohydrate ABC transporter permease [Paenibacillus filicis]
MQLDSPLKKLCIYTFLILGGLVMLIPFYWMFVLSTRTTTEVFNFPPPLVFGQYALTNYQNLLKATPFFLNLWNSIFVATIHTFLVLLFCSMGGYAFAMYNFPGRKYLFAAVLATLMIPWMTGIVPWFMLMKTLGWIDSFKALIIPGIANAFGIFWMRQYISSNIPSELLDSAKIDGCPEFLIFFRVILPLLKPATSALGIMTFIHSWNNFLVPLIIIKNESKLTLPVALNRLFGDPSRGFDIGVMMMGTSLAVLPLLLVFIFAAKKFMDGMTAGAVKG